MEFCATGISENYGRRKRTRTKPLQWMEAPTSSATTRTSCTTPTTSNINCTLYYTTTCSSNPASVDYNYHYDLGWNLSAFEDKSTWHQPAC